MSLIWVRTGNGGADPAVDIDDLGITIPTGAAWTALSAGDSGDPILPGDGYGQFSARELRDSDDLHTLITGGSLEYSTDGATENTETYLADLPLMRDFEDDHLDLTDGRLTLPNDVNPPANVVTPQPGDFFYDTDDGYLVFYSGVTSQWVTITDSGAATDHGTLNGLLDDDHTQYLLLSGNAARNAVTGKVDFGTDSGELGLPKSTDPTANFPSAVAGDLAYDTDDGYLVFFDGTEWVAVRDANTAIDHGDLAGLLDDDHTQYGLLAGDAARNAITGTYDFGDGYFIAPTYPVAPTENVVDGEIFYSNGIMYAYDGTRSKWLSTDRQNIISGKRNNARNVYLRVGNNIATSQTGVRAIRDGTIVGLAAQTDDVETWTLEVRRNNVATPIASFTITAANGGQDDTINVDFDEGDELQFYANTGSTNVRAPVAYVEIAWRA